jgi:protein-S-isoprenylcysteine O-methyltransferase Ste14
VTTGAYAIVRHPIYAAGIWVSALAPWPRGRRDTLARA